MPYLKYYRGESLRPREIQRILGQLNCPFAGHGEREGRRHCSFQPHLQTSAGEQRKTGPRLYVIWHPDEQDVSKFVIDKLIGQGLSAGAFTIDEFERARKSSELIPDALLPDFSCEPRAVAR